MQESLFETKEILQNTDKIKAQSNLFKSLLHDIVRHAMTKLAGAIDWQSFEDGCWQVFAQPKRCAHLPLCWTAFHGKIGVKSFELLSPIACCLQVPKWTSSGVRYWSAE